MRAFCKNQRGPISRPCDNPLGAFRIRNRIDDRDVSGKTKKRVFRISCKSFGKRRHPDAAASRRAEWCRHHRGFAWLARYKNLSELDFQKLKRLFTFFTCTPDDTAQVRLVQFNLAMIACGGQAIARIAGHCVLLWLVLLKHCSKFSLINPDVLSAAKDRPQKQIGRGAIHDFGDVDTTHDAVQLAVIEA
jgi:hypothetical protein